MDDTQFLSIDGLSSELATEHFRIHYGHRNAIPGRGSANHGVATEALVREYAKALEDAYQGLAGCLLGLPKPSLDEVELDRKIRVTVRDIRPYHGGTAYQRDKCQRKVLRVGLASRGAEATLEQELQRARATAAHETLHVFTRPLCRPSFYVDAANRLRSRWEWFDEGTAVYTEMLVAPDIDCCLGYLPPWCDEPHTPLDEPSPVYAAAAFVSFLARHYGSGFVGEAWRKASSYDTPLGLLEAMLQAEGLPFASSDPVRSDFFTSTYCVDTYFLSDPGTTCPHPRLLVRHGERLLTECFGFAGGAAEAIGDFVDHLGCRYYRFDPPPGAQRLDVTVGYDARGERAPLRAELVPADRDSHKLDPRVVLQPHRQDQKVVLSGAFDLTQVSAGQLGHVVLVVANCSFGAEAEDRVKFDLHATAE